MIKENPDGNTVDVTFQRNLLSGVFRKKTYTAQKSVLYRKVNSSGYFLVSESLNNLWVQMIEKTFSGYLVEYDSSKIDFNNSDCGKSKKNVFKVRLGEILKVILDNNGNSGLIGLGRLIMDTYLKRNNQVEANGNEGVDFYDARNLEVNTPKVKVSEHPQNAVGNGYQFRGCFVGCGSVTQYDDYDEPKQNIERYEEIPTVKIGRKGKNLTANDTKKIRGGKKLAKRVVIRDGVTGIEKHTFDLCGCIEELEIPSGVELPNDAFMGCAGLKSVKLFSNMESRPLNVFYSCDMLEGVEIVEGTKEIYPSFFKDCKVLKEVKLPKSLERISNSAFEGCEMLGRVELGDNIKEIRSYAFKDCTSLREIKLPKNIQRIGCKVFEGCISLEKVEIEGGIEKIETGAFKNCTSLREIRLPKSVKEVEEGAFEGCKMLEK